MDNSSKFQQGNLDMNRIEADFPTGLGRSRDQPTRPMAIPRHKGQALRSTPRTRTKLYSDNDTDPDPDLQVKMNAAYDSLDEGGYPQSVSMSRMSMSGKSHSIAARAPTTDTESFTSYETSTGVSPKSHPTLNFGELSTNPSFWSKTSKLYSPSEKEVDGAGSGKRSATLSPTIMFTDSPLSVTRPASSAGSVASLGSVFEWSPFDILALSNRVRAAVQHKGIHGIYADDIETLCAMLNRLLHDELAGKGVDFSVIVEGRIDRMLDVLCDEPKTLFEDSLKCASIDKAFVLRSKWGLRFGLKYATTDVARLSTLKQKWFTNKSTPFSDVDLGVGSWWPSLECVFRDGIIRNLDEVASHGRYGPFWMLPMLTGNEVDGPAVGLYTFTREGSEHDMHTRLMTAGGKKIKVLRGHTLGSKYAPTAGIRYDGEYTLEVYSRLPSQDPNFQKLALVLRRVDGQMSVKDLQKIPTPSQLDDYQIYNEIAR